MGDLVASSVTVILAPQDLDFLGAKRVSYPSISFGNGILNYPSNGVPLPAIGMFGMKQEIKRVFLQPPYADGYVYKYDSLHHSIRIYQAAADPGAPSIAAASGGTPAGTISQITPAGSVAAPAFSGTPISPGTPEGTVDSDDHEFHGAAMGNITPAGSVTAPAFSGTPVTPTFSGAALATHTHALTGASGVAAPLVELGNVAVAATTIPMMVIGQ